MKKAVLLVLALVAVGCADPIPRNLDELELAPGGGPGPRGRPQHA